MRMNDFALKGGKFLTAVLEQIEHLSLRHQQMSSTVKALFKSIKITVSVGKFLPFVL